MRTGEVRVVLAHRVTLAAYVLLLAQQALDAGMAQAPVVIWAVKLLPLLLFLPGMARDRLRSFIWLCFVCLGYFVVLVERIFAQPSSVLVVFGLCAVVVLFVSAMLYVRWRARQLRDTAPATDSGA